MARSLPRRRRATSRTYFLPRTTLGRWCLGAFGLLLVLYVLTPLLVFTLPAEFNLLTTISAFLAVGSAVATVVLGALAFFRSGERAVLVSALALLLAGAILFFLLGEILIPH